ncbi:hypothetical protein [Sphingomonas sp.]|uniref:hypothetical protein n=1 Tax=Sphingomonas sp. TaxID=28214 RepID=UPI003B3BD082
MRMASLSWSNIRDGRVTRRATPLVLTILAHIAILLLLLQTTAFRFRPPPPGDGPLVTMDIAPEAQPEARRSRAPQRVRRAERAPSAPPRPPEQQQPREKPDVAQPWVLMPGLESFDLRQVRSDPSARQSTQGSAQGEAETADSGSVYGPTNAPGGGRLYNAEWFREPTDAELSFYMPRGVVGWGVIACQTAERYHVENCREIADSPPGSGLARAIREASWQFLVRPPRINGKPVVGSWVRIRIDLTPAGSRVK